MANERFFKKNKKIRKKRTPVIVFTFVAGAIILALCIYNSRIVPIISDIALSNAETVVQTTVAREISQFIESSGNEYKDMINYVYDGNGNIISYSVDQSKVNKLINEATEVISISASLEDTYVMIPLGSVFDNAFFNGTGPKIKFRMIFTTSTFIDVVNEFQAQGINQTRHIIKMNVSIPILLLLPGKSIESEIKTTFIVNDSVIIGEVPDISLGRVELNR